MEYKEERDWKNVREYLEKKKVEYSIMEERIDVYVQRRFIAHLRNLQKKPREFKKKQSDFSGAFYNEIMTSVAVWSKAAIGDVDEVFVR